MSAGAGSGVFIKKLPNDSPTEQRDTRRTQTTSDDAPEDGCSEVSRTVPAGSASSKRVRASRTAAEGAESSLSSIRGNRCDQNHIKPTVSLGILIMDQVPGYLLVIITLLHLNSFFLPPRHSKLFNSASHRPDSGFIDLQ